MDIMLSLQGKHRPLLCQASHWSLLHLPWQTPSLLGSLNLVKKMEQSAYSTKCFANFAQSVPVSHPFRGKGKISLLLSHINDCNYYLQGSPNFVKNRIR